LENLEVKMPDNLHRIRPEDPRTISTQDHELEYWSKELGVSRQALRAAIDAVGNSVGKIAEYLRRRR
jgi:hypothetical protein